MSRNWEKARVVQEMACCRALRQVASTGSVHEILSDTFPAPGGRALLEWLGADGYARLLRRPIRLRTPVPR